MPYLTGLAEVLRSAGLPVREIPGWQSRGHGPMNSAVEGVLCHHTAGPATGNYPSENVVVNGRPGLPGPLANLGLARDGTWVVVAAGLAYHAGPGSLPWCPPNQGNARLVGVEGESVGTRDDWTPQQRVNYPRGVAALLAHLRLGPDRVAGHKEWAPRRKIDPAFWDMNQFRADVARWMRSPLEDDMPSPQDVWDFRIPDPYDGSLKPARDLVGWAATHAAYARSEAAEARKAAAAAQAEAAGLRAAVDALAEAVGEAAGTSAVEIRQAVLDAIRDGLVQVEITVRGQQPSPGA